MSKQAAADRVVAKLDVLDQYRRFNATAVTDGWTFLGWCDDPPSHADLFLVPQDRPHRGPEPWITVILPAGNMLTERIDLITSEKFPEGSRHRPLFFAARDRAIARGLWTPTRGIRRLE